MEPTNLTIEILKDIRDEARRMGDRIDQTNDRLDQTNERLETMREELSRRIVESEIRTSTAITDLAGTVRELTSYLKQANDLRPRLEQCEVDIIGIKRRLG